VSAKRCGNTCKVATTRHAACTACGQAPASLGSYGRLCTARQTPKPHSLLASVTPYATEPSGEHDCTPDSSPVILEANHRESMSGNRSLVAVYGDLRMAAPRERIARDSATFWADNRQFCWGVGLLFMACAISAITFSKSEYGVVLGLLACAILTIAILWLVPRAQVSHVHGLSAEKRQELEDKARGTLAQVLGGTFFLATGYFTWLGIVETRHAQSAQTKQANDSLSFGRQTQNEQFRIATRGQMTDRLRQAVDLLSVQGSGPGALVKRLGGIYALESIAKDSPQDEPTVVEVLISYVRLAWPPRDEPSKTDWLALPTDVQAALTVLGRRTTYAAFPERAPLNLASMRLWSADLDNANLFGSDLRNAFLTKATLQGANLNAANLQNVTCTFANLTNTHLARADLMNGHLDIVFASGAVFDAANMYSASLHNAKLAGASFKGSQMWLANLDYADLTGVDLSGANLGATHMKYVRLKDAKLLGTKFSGAKLIHVDVSGSDFTGANLCGADFRETNISQEQLNRIGKASSTTKVNSGVTVPKEAIERGRLNSE
jgi:uncharacterized protein YjbI with pentapeptide repeats